MQAIESTKKQVEDQLSINLGRRELLEKLEGDTSRLRVSSKAADIV